MTLDWSWWARISHVEKQSRREHQGVPSAGGVSIWHGDPAIPLFGIYPRQTCTSQGKDLRMLAYSIVCSKGKLENKWVVVGWHPWRSSGWLGLCPSTVGAWVPSLIGAMRSYMPCGVVKKNFLMKKKKKRGHWLNNLKSIHAFGLFCNN